MKEKKSIKAKYHITGCDIAKEFYTGPLLEKDIFKNTYWPLENVHVLSDGGRGSKIQNYNIHYDPNYLKNEYICRGKKGQKVKSGHLWKV